MTSNIPNGGIPIHFNNCTVPVTITPINNGSACNPYQSVVTSQQLPFNLPLLAVTYRLALCADSTNFDHSRRQLAGNRRQQVTSKC